MSLRHRIEQIVDGMPPGSSVSLPVTWLRDLLEAEPESTDGDPLLTLEEVAERVGRATSTVRGWCNSGELAGAFKLNGRDWKIPESALERYLEGQTTDDPVGPALGSGADDDLGSWREHLESQEATP